MVKSNEKDYLPKDTGEFPKGAEEKGRTVEVIASYGETVSKDYQSQNFYCSLKETVPLSKQSSTYKELYQRCREEVATCIKEHTSPPQVEEQNYNKKPIKKSF